MKTAVLLAVLVAASALPHEPIPQGNTIAKRQTNNQGINPQGVGVPQFFAVQRYDSFEDYDDSYVRQVPVPSTYSGNPAETSGFLYRTFDSAESLEDYDDNVIFARASVPAYGNQPKTPSLGANNPAESPIILAKSRLQQITKSAIRSSPNKFYRTFIDDSLELYDDDDVTYVYNRQPLKAQTKSANSLKPHTRSTHPILLRVDDSYEQYDDDSVFRYVYAPKLARSLTYTASDIQSPQTKSFSALKKSSSIPFFRSFIDRESDEIYDDDYFGLEYVISPNPSMAQVKSSNAPKPKTKSVAPIFRAVIDRDSYESFDDDDIRYVYTTEPKPEPSAQIKSANAPKPKTKSATPIFRAVIDRDSYESFEDDDIRYVYATEPKPEPSAHIKSANAPKPKTKSAAPIFRAVIDRDSYESFDDDDIRYVYTTEPKPEPSAQIKIANAPKPKLAQTKSSSATKPQTRRTNTPNLKALLRRVNSNESDESYESRD